jgi:hypothetical protein
MVKRGNSNRRQQNTGRTGPTVATSNANGKEIVRATDTEIAPINSSVHKSPAKRKVVTIAPDVNVVLHKCRQLRKIIVDRADSVVTQDNLPTVWKWLNLAQVM